MTRSYQFDVDSPDQIQNIIGGILLEMDQAFQQADYTKEMQDYLDKLNIVHEGYFDKDAGPSGEKWQPLAQYTIQKKGHATILEEFRDMKRSVTESGAPGAIRSATHRGLVFGTSDEKSIFHQEGTGKIPKREFVGMGEQTVNELVEKVADATMEKITK